MAYIQDPLQSPIPRTNATNNTLQGQFPAPGGPNPAPQTSVRDTLMKELANAGQVAEKTRSSIGMGAPEGEATSTVPFRGLKVGNKIVAQAELDEFTSAQGKAIDDYVRSAGYKNQHDINFAKHHITSRMNDRKLKLIKMANDFNKKLMKEKVSEEERGMFAKNFGAIAGAIVGGVAGGFMTAGNPMGIMTGASVGGTAGGAVGNEVGKS